MRVLIEASELTRNAAGIGRFGRALLAHLPPDVAVTAVPNGKRTHAHAVGLRTLSARLRHAAQHLALTQGRAGWSAVRQRPDVLHAPSFFYPLMSGRAPVVCTVFDLIPFEHPPLADRFWGAYARRTLPLFIKRAAHVMTASNATRFALIDRFDLPPERVTCVGAGVDAVFYPSDAEEKAAVRARYQLPDEFALAVGAWMPHKDLTTLLRAAAPLHLPVVVTGAPHTVSYRTLVTLADELRVPLVVAGHIPDADLRALYSLATVTVIASRAEGFGLPALEAQACGSSLICADIPALRESAGEAAWFFPPGDSEALRDALCLALMSSEDRHRRRTLGLARAAEWTWDAVAMRVVAVWRNAHDRC